MSAHDLEKCSICGSGPHFWSPEKVNHMIGFLAEEGYVTEQWDEELGEHTYKITEKGKEYMEENKVEM